jgi:outer membrane cobalamin receptor
MQGQRIILLLLPFLSIVTAEGQDVRNDTVTDRVHQLQEVTVTESRRQHSLTSTAPMHILDSEQILMLGITDVADALHRIPGVTLRDYGGAGGMKTVSVRGFGAKHTGVSYDGIMLSDCQSGEIDLSRYSLDNVEHLSLVIGDNDDIFIPARNASASAVLNIQTIGLPSEDTDPHLTAQLKMGSFGYVSPFLRYEQNISDKFAFAAIGEYTYAENDYPFEIQNVSQVVKDRRTNSRMNSGHGELNFVWNVDAFSRWSGKLYYYDNDRQLPGQVHYYTNLNKETLRDRNFFAQLQYQTHHQSGWSLKWHGKFNWNASIYHDPLAPNQHNDASYWQREAYTSLAALYTPSDTWAFDYSADYAFNNLTSSSSHTVDNKPFRHTLLQSVSAKYRAGRLTALARLLYSLYLNDSEFGKSAHNMRRLSPSLSLSYRLLADEDLFVRASYKNIFRSPTFNESYYFHYGSPDLLPESTDQLNIGTTYHLQSSNFNVQLTADGYYNHVKDMIVAVPYNMFIWTCVNVGKVQVLGADVTAQASRQLYEGHSLLFSGCYSYQQAENRTNEESPYYGNQIAYMPKHSGSAAVGWENPWANLSVHVTGVSSRWANNQHYEETEIEGYWDMGVTIYRHFRWKDQCLEARMDVKNILNAQYEIVRFYPMPGRSWQVSLKYQL